MPELEVAPELSLNPSARRILLSGKIDEVASHDFREALLELAFEDPTQPVTIYIDTYGGSSYSMFAMYDAMLLAPFPINTIGTGKIMSAGVLLLAAGTNRYLTPNTVVMMHQVSTEMQGSISQLGVEVGHVKELQDRMYKLYAHHSNQTPEIIQRDLKQDKYLTALEAVKYGFADKILGGDAE